MKKMMLTASAFIVTLALFAQNSSTPAPVSKETKIKATPAPSNIAVSDPGTPNSRTAAPAPASTAPAQEAPKPAKHKGSLNHKK